MIAGIGSIFKQRFPFCKVFGVEPVGSSGLTNSLNQNEALKNVKTDSIADSLSPPLHMDYSFSICKNVIDESIELSNKITKNSPAAIKLAIQSMVSGMNCTYFESFDIENNLFSSLFESEETKEGIDAFLNKRVPDFKGK